MTNSMKNDEPIVPLWEGKKKIMTLSGPMFESNCELMKNVHKERGSHYSIWSVCKGKELETLKLFFPDGECDEMNLILFSTSGVHGSYTTIDEIEKSLLKYGEDPAEEIMSLEDWCPPYLTGLIIQPRLVCMRYFGEMKVKIEDIPYLKKLRDSAFKNFVRIGVDQ